MEQLTFFQDSGTQPLADRMRPRTLEEFGGLENVIGWGGFLRRLF